MFHLDWTGSIRQLHNPFGFGAFHYGTCRPRRPCPDGALSIWIRGLPFGSRISHLNWAGSILELQYPFGLGIFHYGAGRLERQRHERPRSKWVGANPNDICREIVEQSVTRGAAASPEAYSNEAAPIRMDCDEIEWISGTELFGEC